MSFQPANYGIDISNHQNLVDAKAVRDNGITFAWLKASEGDSFRDGTLHDYAAKLMAVGITVGVYHFARPGDAAAQARYFKEFAGEFMRKGNLRPALDLEADASVEDTWHNAFHDALGIPSMIYGSLSWWRNLNINPPGWGQRDVLGWVAEYNGEPGQPSWVPPKCVVHQHSSTGNVPGLPGPIDRNATLPGASLATITLG